MFFKSKSKKIDSKVRFQHQDFTKQVKSAAQYKRQPREIPQTPKQKFLVSFGLETWRSRVLVIVGLIALIYIVYIPNPFYIKQIDVIGVDSVNGELIAKGVESYFDSSPKALAQKNVLLINSNKLSEYLKSHIPQVERVQYLKRGMGKLTISIIVKAEQFVVLAPEQTVIVYSDGTVARRQVPEQDVPSGLIKIKSQKNLNESSKIYFEPNFAKPLTFLANNFGKEVGLSPLYYELPVETKNEQATSEDSAASENYSLSSEFDLPEEIIIPNEVWLYLPKTSDANGPTYKVRFDLTTDLADSLINLKALLEQMTPSRKSALVYIDMRFKDKSFLCLSGSPCAAARSVTVEQPIQTETKIK